MYCVPDQKPNRLIRAEKGSVKFEAAYDYMGRRFEKKLYDGETLTVHRKFVYDGYKLIGVYDALNNDAEELSFVWQPETAGLDVPLSMKHDNAAYYYVTDGNKNVTALYDATGAEAANYVYGPFGQTLAANGRGGESPAAVDYEGGKVAAICNLLSCNGDEMHRPEDLDLDMLFCMELGGDSGIGGDGNASALRTVFGMEAMDRRQYGTSTTPALPPGGLALVNPFRFSSEFHDDELGLVYYNYRYYNPQLGRWTKRDPIGEEGGINPYFIVANNITYYFDHLGLAVINSTKKQILKIKVVRFSSGDPQVPITNAAGKNDISGFEGFKVDVEPPQCCCSDGKTKNVILVQLLNDGWLLDHWRLDAHFVNVRAGDLWKDSSGVYRHYGYTDQEIGIDGTRGDSGRRLNSSIAGYVDTPGLESHAGGETITSPATKKKYLFRTEAFCRCDTQDEYTGNSVDFTVIRPAGSAQIELTITKRNFIGDPLKNPSKYPEYKSK